MIYIKKLAPITKEEKFWLSEFGSEYLERNKFSNQELDQLYINNFGVSRSRLNNEFLGKLKLKNILEVGCNIGNQLTLLQNQGFKNLYGIEISPEAVETSKNRTKDINIIQSSAFDIPFKDSCFDLVFTAGILIHINPKDIKKIMKEIYRVSNKYVWGYEYYHPTHIDIEYRGNKNRLWKGDFCQMYLGLFPNFKVIKRKKLKYLNSENQDEMFLLKKI